MFPWVRGRVRVDHFDRDLTKEGGYLPAFLFLGTREVALPPYH